MPSNASIKGGTPVQGPCPASLPQNTKPVAVPGVSKPSPPDFSSGKGLKGPQIAVKNPRKGRVHRPRSMPTVPDQGGFSPDMTAWLT